MKLSKSEEFSVSLRGDGLLSHCFWTRLYFWSKWALSPLQKQTRTPIVWRSGRQTPQGFTPLSYSGWRKWLLVTYWTTAECSEPTVKLEERRLHEHCFWEIVHVPQFLKLSAHNGWTGALSNLGRPDSATNKYWWPVVWIGLLDTINIHRFLFSSSICPTWHMPGWTYWAREGNLWLAVIGWDRLWKNEFWYRVCTRIKKTFFFAEQNREKHNRKIPSFPHSSCRILFNSEW